MVYFLGLLFVYIKGIGAPDSIRKYCSGVQTKRSKNCMVPSVGRASKRRKSFAGAGRKKIHAQH